MANHDVCDFCVDPGNKIIHSAFLPRSEALTLYVRLQVQGRFPAMCENDRGKFTVCYSEALGAQA